MENQRDEALAKIQKLSMDEVKNSNAEKNLSAEKVNSEPIKIISEIAGVDNIVYETEKL